MPKTKLYHPINAPKGKTFDKAHAEKIMGLKNNGGWTEKSQDADTSGTTSKKAGTTKADTSDTESAEPGT